MWFYLTRLQKPSHLNHPSQQHCVWARRKQWDRWNGGAVGLVLLELTPQQCTYHDGRMVALWNCVFLALLCAPEQQSYCRHAGVRPSPVVRPSLKLVSPEPVKYINAIFSAKVPFHHISRPFLQFQNVCYFFTIFFSFSLRWGIWENKLQTTSPLKENNRLTPKKACILLLKVSTKVVLRLQNFKFWILQICFSISLTWGHMGKKPSNDILSESTPTYLLPKIHAYSQQRPLPKLYKCCEISNFDFWALNMGINEKLQKCAISWKPLIVDRNGPKFGPLG